MINGNGLIIKLHIPEQSDNGKQNRKYDSHVDKFPTYIRSKYRTEKQRKNGTPTDKVR